MKKIAILLLGFSVLAFASPVGFEDPVLLSKVMKGDIVIQHDLVTTLEYKTSVRAFFKEVTPEEYVDLYTNHKAWIGLLPEIVDAKTNSVNADKTVFAYWLHVKAKQGFFTFDVYPEGQQTITFGEFSDSEWLAQNTVTNYKEELKLAEENERLIPYQHGILVEQIIHVVLQKASTTSQMMKDQIEQKFVALVTQFRKKLGGES